MAPHGDATIRSQSDSRTARMLAALSFAVTVIGVGVPVWLKTTEIYRASIPYSGIAALEDLPLDSVTGAHLQVVAPTAGEAARLAQQLVDHLPGVIASGRAFVERERKVLATAADAWTVDDSVNSGEGCDQLRVVVLAGPSAASAPAPVMFGRHCDILVVPSTEVPLLVEVLSSVLFTADSDAVSTRRVKSSPAYNLLVSIVVPEPGADAPRWNGAAATRSYLEPVAKQLLPLANVSVQSQYLYHAGLGVAPKFDEETGEYYLSEEQLSLVITPLEARLGSAVAGTPTLHFIVYIPPVSRRPLRIRPAGPTDAFLSPRWGGVQIYNPLPGEKEVDSRRVSSVLVSQLRLLLGTRDLPDGVVARPSGAGGLRGWELFSMRRRRTLDNVDTARRNLASLAAMLEQISNIVIDDGVGAAVEEGVSSCNKAAQLLSEGREAEAYASSCRALANSERAIFDPSMLALLYFPDDQKYAVYIPLFLPVSIPIIMSLRSMWKWARGHPEKVKTE